MNITLSSKANSKNKRGSKLQKKFDKLWQKIKNKQAANARLKNDLSKLHVRYQNEVLPKERLLEDPYVKLTQRLTEFLSRKSLALWHHEELSYWITDNILALQPLNPEISEELEANFKRTLSDFLGVTVEQLERESQQEEFMNELMEDALRSVKEALLKGESSDFMNDLFGFPEEEDEPDFDNHTQSESAEQVAYNEKASPQIDEEQLISEKWLRSIFRKTANALHPDKETDDALKSEKERLMTDLVKARDNNDVFSLINLYMNHVEVQDLAITEETMKSLYKQLEEQEIQLDYDRDEIILENPVYEAIYERFYSRSKKEQEQKIKDHLDALEDYSESMFELEASLKNLKVLKDILAARRDHRHSARMDEEYGWMEDEY